MALGWLVLLLCASCFVLSNVLLMTRIPFTMEEDPWCMVTQDGPEGIPEGEAHLLCLCGGREAGVLSREATAVHRGARGS